MGEGTRIYDTDGNYTVFGLLGRNLLGSELACLSGCSGNIETRLNAVENLSADEISAALQGGTTTGTSTALVATVPGSPSLSDGLLVMVELHTATGSFPTLNLNSLGAKLLYKGTQSGVTGLASGQLPQFSKALLMFSTTLDGWFVLNGLKSVAADIPSTLNATAFGGDVTASTLKSSGASLLLQTAGPVTRAIIGDSYSYLTGPVICWATANFIIRNKDADHLTALCGGASDTPSNTQASLFVYGATNPTYPGVHQQFAPLKSRDPSTAFAVCPVGSTDMAQITIFDSMSVDGEIVISVSPSGEMVKNGPSNRTLEYVNSASPASFEVGYYISAGVFYLKPGSSFTGNIATFSKIGKA